MLFFLQIQTNFHSQGLALEIVRQLTHEISTRGYKSCTSISKLDGVAPLMTDPPPTSSTTLQN